MANTIKIKDEAAFQVNAPTFAISPSATGYTLLYSADGVNFSEWFEATPADKTQVVANAANGMYFKLGGNVGEVVITY